MWSIRCVAGAALALLFFVLAIPAEATAARVEIRFGGTLTRVVGSAPDGVAVGTSFSGRFAYTLRSADVSFPDYQSWAFTPAEATLMLAFGGVSYVGPPVGDALGVRIANDQVVDPRTGQPVAPNQASILLDNFGVLSSASTDAGGGDFRLVISRTDPGLPTQGPVVPGVFEIPTLLDDASLPEDVSRLRDLLVGGRVAAARVGVPFDEDWDVEGEIEWAAAPIPEPGAALLALVGACVVGPRCRRVRGA